MPSLKKRLAAAADKGTPVYVYDMRSVEQAFRKMRRAFPRFEIFYAVKANPHLEILSFLAKMGSGADAASGGELKAALRAGIPPDKISFAGPGKTEDELVFAVRSSIAAISIESLEELKMLNRIAARLKKRVSVTLRVNPLQHIGKAGIKMAGGVPSQFGIPEEDLPRVFGEFPLLKNLVFKGIHIYTGSQILEYSAALEQFRVVLDTCAKLPERFKAELSLINFGGGFGIPYFANEKPLDLEKLSLEVRKLIAAPGVFSGSRACRLIIEPGRYLVAESGFYVVKALYRKVCRGKTFIITDGGMNHHLAAAGLLGAVIRKNYPLDVISRRPKGPVEAVTLTGPCCTPLDVIGRDVELPRIEPGDYIILKNSGAYGLTASPVNFLSHKPAREHIVSAELG